MVANLRTNVESLDVPGSFAFDAGHVDANGQLCETNNRAVCGLSHQDPDRLLESPCEKHRNLGRMVIGPIRPQISPQSFPQPCISGNGLANANLYGFGTHLESYFAGSPSAFCRISLCCAANL